MRPGWRGETLSAFSSASARAISAEPAPSLASEALTAASSAAGSVRISSPAASRSARRALLAEARTRGIDASSGAVGAAAMLAQQLDDAGGGLLDGAAGDVQDRPAMFGAEPACLGQLLADGIRIDIVGLVVLPHEAQAVAPDLDELGRILGQADDERLV